MGASGETRHLTDNTGVVTDSYYYEAYGANLASTGTTYNPHQYGGKFGYYKDEASDVLLATWRWYSPSQMKWISRDPIKFDGGSNVYQYVAGNPVMYVDPDGLRPLTTAEKKLLKPYIPQVDLDNADVDEDGLPVYTRLTPTDIDAITRNNKIYINKKFKKCGKEKIALLAHELIHVGQYRRGELTALSYFSEVIKNGSGPSNKYEEEGYELYYRVLKNLYRNNTDCSCESLK